MIRVLFSMLLCCATLAPFLKPHSHEENTDAFPGWPHEIVGRTISQIELTLDDKRFTADFPGKVGRFSDGAHEVLLRWVPHTTRALHPASDCFRGAGYAIHPLPLERDIQGEHWGCFQALKGPKALKVCEKIYDQKGNSWADTSSWYWHAVLGKSNGPYWAATILSVAKD